MKLPSYPQAFLLSIGLFFHFSPGIAQTTFPLYGVGKIPNMRPDSVLIDTPTLTLLQPAPEQNTGIAVIICPGGAYKRVSDKGEALPAARKLAAAGITAFSLHYRVPRADWQINKEFVPVEDAQTAIKYVREHAKEYGIDPHKIGIMGFSAGGHLASTIATHYQHCYIENADSTSLRPDFQVLVYPLVSFADSLTHIDSRYNLIGPELSPEKIMEYSNEWHVTAQTPPAFIVHAVDDKVVKIANSLEYIAALQQNNVAVRVFFYSRGNHGYGANNKTATVQWTDPCISWIKSLAF